MWSLSRWYQVNEREGTLLTHQCKWLGPPGHRLTAPPCGITFWEQNRDGCLWHPSQHLGPEPENNVEEEQQSMRI